jgi:uncharacterized protein YecE (DUF72 family)
VIRIGTAGWAIPKLVTANFPAQGSRLERYAARFACAEINSTFYRTHRAATYERWAQSVPADFRFSVKLPKAITHERRLAGCLDLLDRFLEEVSPLGEKLGPLLIQLPPSLAFDAAIAETFLHNLRNRHAGLLACEPRHPTWFGSDASRLLDEYRVARAAADPASVPEAGQPGGWPGLLYFRLHGSPRMYFSPYPPAFLASTAAHLQESRADHVWCIFDNTASGAAAADALALADRIAASNE